MTSTRNQHAAATLRRGGKLLPPRTLPYRVLARTCEGCGQLLTTPGDRLRQGSRRPPECKCFFERRRRAASNSERVRRSQERACQERRRLNAESRDSATRHYNPWLASDVRVLAQEDQDVAAAKLTGRTVFAVQVARRRYTNV